MRPALGFAMLALVIASGMPATAHHSNPFYFDMANVMTLEGVVLRQSSRIVGGGQIRLSSGDVLAFGGGPTF